LIKIYLLLVENEIQLLLPAFYQVLVHLTKRFQRIQLFKNQSTRNKDCLCQPC